MRDKTNIVLFEAKARALTRKAQTIDMIAFIEDYKDSYLSSLQQLVRHDRNLFQFPTPLASTRDDLKGLDTLKVAISTLSFGPVSDKSLANTLFRAASQGRYAAASPNDHAEDILASFNEIIGEIVSELASFPAGHKADDLFRYLMSVFWQDLGQLIYILGRSTSVETAFSAFQNVTFSSRDFWTEIANLDRLEVTSKRLLPPREGWKKG